MVTNIETYTTAADWLAGAGEQLYEHEEANSLIVGIAERVARATEPVEPQPYFAAVYEGERLVAAALMTPPHNVVFSMDSAADPGALALVARNLLEHNRPVPGVLAPPAVAAAFASLWCAATGECSNVRRRGRAHALRRVVQTRYSPGDLRPAVEGDRDLLLRWWRGFSIDALEEDDPQTAADLTERTLRGGDAFLWVDGTPVSLAARGRPTRHGITITGVYTPPEHRRRGYAGSAVARLSAQLLVEGRAFVAINTDLANPTANHIYYEVGYRPVGDMDELQFKPRA